MKKTIEYSDENRYVQEWGTRLSRLPERILIEGFEKYAGHTKAEKILNILALCPLEEMKKECEKLENIMMEQYLTTIKEVLGQIKVKYDIEGRQIKITVI